jgi:TPR repeat protein
MTDVDNDAREFFATQLKRLWRAAGRPKLATVSDAAGLSGPQRISDWMNRRHVPDARPLADLVTVLVQRIKPERRPSYGDLVDASIWQRWRMAAAKPGRHGEADSSREGDTELGWLLSGLTESFALSLDVHPAIEVLGTPDLGPLPTYVRRPHDDDLDEAVRRANEHNVLQVLIGESTSGKTRAGWEALANLPAGWRLWHPISPTPIEAFDAGLGGLRPRTVIWLDEIYEYVSSERVAAQLFDLVRDHRCVPLLILGTTRIALWESLIAEPPPGAPDPHPRARALLRGTEITVPGAFLPDDLAALRRAAKTDARLRLAVDQGTNEVTQFLAGTPELLRRYARAPAEMKAVIHAAMDAYRLGAARLLPEPFLHRAATGYIEERVWERVGSGPWFESAIDWLGRPALGVPGPVSHVPPRPVNRLTSHRMYRLADQLTELAAIQRRNDVPPPAMWQAAQEHIDDPAVLTAMARSASDRAYYRIAASLALNAAERGSEEAGQILANLAQRQGRNDVAMAWRLWCARSTSDSLVTWRLAQAYKEKGDMTAARRWWRRTVELDRGRSISDLLPTLTANGWLLSAVEWLRPATEAGHPSALTAVARLLDEVGRTAEALTWYERAAAAGDEYDAARWAHRLAELGRHGEAASVWQKQAELGDGLAMVHLAECQLAMGADPYEWLERAVPIGGKGYLKIVVPLLTEAGRVDDAARLILLHADRGDFRATARASNWLIRLGRPEGARRVWLPLVESGDPTAMWYLGRLLEAAGEQDAAERMYRAAAVAGDLSALRQLADLYLGRGEPDAAMTLWQSAVSAGWPWAVVPLAELLIDNGRSQEAEALAREASERGNCSAMVFLGEHLSDPAEAERWLRTASQDGVEGSRALAKWLENAGRPYEAVEVWQPFVRRGDHRALGRTIDILRRADDLDRVDRLHRTAMEAGHLGAKSYLENDEALARYGIEPGGGTASRWSIKSPPG